MSDLTTFFNFRLTLFKWSVKIFELCHAIYKEKIYSGHLEKKTYQDITKLKLV